MVTCERARDWVSSYIDGELSSGAAERFEVHVRSCASCHRVLEETQNVVGLAQAVGKSSRGVAEQTRAKLLAAFRSARNVEHDLAWVDSALASLLVTIGDESDAGRRRRLVLDELTQHDPVSGVAAVARFLDRLVEAAPDGPVQRRVSHAFVDALVDPSFAGSRAHAPRLAADCQVRAHLLALDAALTLDFVREAQTHLVEAMTLLPLGTGDPQWTGAVDQAGALLQVVAGRPRAAQLWLDLADEAWGLVSEAHQERKECGLVRAAAQTLAGHADRAGATLRDWDAPALADEAIGPVYEAALERPLRSRHAAFSALLLRVQRSALPLLPVDIEAAAATVQIGVALARELGSRRDLALGLRALANVAGHRREHLQSLEGYERAAEILRETSDDPSNDIELGITLGNSLLARRYVGDPEDARRAIAEARSIYEGSAQPLRLARLLINAGTFEHRREDFRVALASFQEALDLLGQCEDAAPTDFAAAWSNVALCEIALDEPDAAIASYRRVQEVCDAAALPELGLAATYNIATVDFDRGRFDEALRAYATVRREGQRLGDRLHAAMADLDRSEVYLELGDDRKAERLARRAQQQLAALGMRFEEGKAHVFQALALHCDGRYQRAGELLDRAAKCFRDEDQKIWGARVELYRGQAALAGGDAAVALGSALDARERFEALEQKDLATTCELLVARCELALERIDASGRSCAQVIAAAQARELPHLLWRALDLLAEIRLVAGDRKVALELLERAVAVLESLRTRVRGEDLHLAFQRDRAAVYERRAHCLLEDVRRSDGATGRAELLLAVDGSRSRALSDRLSAAATTRAVLSEAATKALARVRELRSALDESYRLRPLAALQGLRGTAAQEAASTSELERELLDAVDELAIEAPELGSLQGARSCTMAEVRAALPPKTALLELAIVGGDLLTCVVTHDAVHVVEHGRCGDTLERVGEWEQLLVDRSAAGPEERADFAAPARRVLEDLSRLLVEPLLSGPALDEIERLVVAGDGELQAVPFHALPAGDSWLGERFVVSYTPSAQVLVQLRESTRRSSAQGQGSFIVAHGDAAAPEIEDESRAVASLLPDAEVLLDGEQGLDRLHSDGARARFVHLAAHGIVHAEDARLSALRFGDGRITLLDLYELSLDCELATLSGCATARGHVAAGDELISLSRGLLSAGARSALVSLWDVDDAATRDLMVDFYRHLHAGTDRAGALRAAMREQRGRTGDPLLWSAFVLVGDPGSSST